MNELRTMRDKVVESLKKEEGFESMTVAKVNGFYFAAADVAVPDEKGRIKEYRIGVVSKSKSGEEKANREE